MNVLLYGKKDCCLCEDAKAILHELQQEHDFTWKEIDIYNDNVLLERYQIMIPVIEIEGEEVQAGIIQKDVISKRLTKSS